MVSLAVGWLAAQVAMADEYQVDAVKEAPPQGLAKAIAEKLGPFELKITRGENRTVAEIWLAKEWPIKAGFQPTDTVQYPLSIGQLVGAIRFKRKASDFKGQEIHSGVYTLRYGQQPVDGNHVGTSATRDFLMLLPADADTSPEPLDEKGLLQRSKKAAGSSHPAILSLVKPGPLRNTGAKVALPVMRHTEKPDWWIVQFVGPGRLATDREPTGLRVDLVVVGKGGE
jgi:hypothetical protein